MEVRLAGARLLRSPAGPIGIVALLTLGMAGVLTLSVPLHLIVFSSLPFPNAAQLVVVDGLQVEPYTHRIEDRQAMAEVFPAMTAYDPSEAVVTVAGQAQPIGTTLVRVTPEFFATLGVPLAAGQDLDAHRAGDPAAVVSDSFWQSRLGAAPVAGLAIMINGRRFEVTGVARPTFDFPAGTDVWVPAGALGGRGDWTVIGRMGRGVSVRTTADRLRVILGQVPRATLAPARPPTVDTLQHVLRGDRQRLIWLLWAAALLFLSLTIAGAAYALWGRAVNRRRERTVRLALGASSPRLVAGVLCEAALLVLVAGLVGLGLSVIGTRLVGATVAGPMVGELGAVSRSNLGVLLGTLIVGTLACSGPAIVETAAGTMRRAHGRPTPASSMIRSISLPESIVSVQLGLALALLVGGLLVLRSVATLLGRPLGFNTAHIAVVALETPYAPRGVQSTLQFQQEAGADARVDQGAQAREAATRPARLLDFQEAQARQADTLRVLRAMPGVTAAGELFPFPFAEGADSLSSIERIDPDGRWGDPLRVLERQADADAFNILGVRLVAGRLFDGRDEFLPRSRRVELGLENTTEDSAIVNETLASRGWPGQQSLGRRLHVVGAGDRTVIGVVSDIRESANRLDVAPTVYLPPFAQYVWPAFLVELRMGSASSTSLGAEVRRALGAGVPAVRVRAVADLPDVVLESERNLLVALRLLSAFAVLGTLVAGLGVYAVADEAAATRSRETAVRLALGATSGQILRLALARNVRLILLALPIGAAGAWAAIRLLSHALPQVEPANPAVWLGGVALLAAVGLAAGIRPAWRAGATDPIGALKVPDQ